MIKPAGYKCPNCDRLVRGKLDCDCSPDAQPLFTRDDLVRAVHAGQDSANGRDLYYDDDAEDIVAELLGEKVGP